MKNIKIILLLLLALTNLLGVSNFFENKLKVFDHQDISFFIGNLPILDDNEPDFSTINANAWKSLEAYPRNNIEDEAKVWFRIDLSGIIIPFNAIYFHSLKNNLKVYYPFQIYPTKVAQKSFNAYNNTNSINKQIISLDNEKYTSSDFQFNKIYFSIDIDQKTPLFKFFPVVVGDEENIKEYVINEEILKRNTDYITFFIGNFLFFVSLITFIIFLLRLKSLNWTVLYFSLLMATAGIFYLILSPLSLFFSDFTFTRMLYLLTFYNLIWFFFGLVVASFLKKKWMSFISVLVIINLIMSYIFPDSIHINRLAMLILLAVYNILIIFQLRKSKLDFLNTESLFSVSASLNIFFLLIPLFLPIQNSIKVFGPIGLAIFAWIFSFAVYTYRQYILTINELQMQKIKNLELTESNLESQLSGLKKQLDPHFLFNSLGTLVALIEIDKDSAIDYIQEFSKVYRYLLDTQENNFVTVQEELNFCHAFIFLLKKRFNDSIIATFAIDDEELIKFIPPLSIQMLIENAIKHNIATDEKPLEIKIYTKDNYVIVENSLQLKKHSKPTSKLGLKNLNQRLYLLKQINIIIIESDNKFIAKIPLITEV